MRPPPRSMQVSYSTPSITLHRCFWQALTHLKAFASASAPSAAIPSSSPHPGKEVP